MTFQLFIESVIFCTPFFLPHLVMASINFSSYCFRISSGCVLRSWKSSTTRDVHLGI